MIRGSSAIGLEPGDEAWKHVDIVDGEGEKTPRYIQISEKVKMNCMARIYGKIEFDVFFHDVVVPRIQGNSYPEKLKGIRAN